MDFVEFTHCDSCGAARRETDTGAFYCAASPTGDADCSLTIEAAELDNLAGQVAGLIAHVGNATLRRELAEGMADALANAVYAADWHGQFDDAAWLSACGCKRKVTA